MIAPDIHQQPIQHRATVFGMRDVRTSGMDVKGDSFHKSFQAALDKTNAAADISATHKTRSSAAVTTKPETEEMRFFDFVKGLIDIVNPLQHIPVISTIYRHITGDELSPMGRVAGGALYGGPIGAAFAIASAGTEVTTGKDLEETAMAFFTGDETSPKDTEMAAIEISPEELLATTTDASITARDPNHIIWYDTKNAVEDKNIQATVSPKLASTHLPADMNSKLPSPSHYPSTSTPTSYHIEVHGEYQSATNLPYTQPIVQKESSPNAPVDLTAMGEATDKKEILSDGRALSYPLAMQEALAKETDRTSVPPELIAIQMMDGLDKYTAMKKQSMAPHQLQSQY